METEIKFRVFCATDNGNEMVYFEPMKFDNGLWFQAMQAHIDEHLSEPMQFTGLKDREGVEIFGGDIIKWMFDNGREEPNEQVLHSLSWDGRINANSSPFMSAWGSTCGNYFRTFMNIYDPTRFATVIGNIHQSPLLIDK